MNYRMTSFILGRMLGVEALVMVIPAIVSAIYGEETMRAFLITSAVLMVLFLIFGRKKPENAMIYAKEGFVIVALAWILWSVFGALPFYISGTIPKYIDALFETVSGFTTTGSTILTDIASLPMGMNFWRCLTHWIGGMGVLVFVLVLTSLDDKNTMHLMRAEVPGPEADKLVPKVRGTAKILYGMYLALTLIEVGFLLAGGMNLYDSVIHAFSTAGTGGFNNRNNSVAFYDSAYIDGVITVFMILFGINFNLYFFILLKDWKSILKNEELWAYLGIVGVSIAIITGNILKIYGTVAHAFRYASFQVGSIITTTGFATADYDQWPELSKSILLALMFVGACAGSTGGGIKVSRVLILLKSVKKELKQYLHPSVVEKIKMDGKIVEHEVVRSTNVFMVAYVLIFAVSVLLISLDEYDLVTNFTAVTATFNNIGPGLALVGPTGNFGFFSNFSKVVLIFDMLAGRLEIFPLLLLFSRETWKRF